MTMALGLRAGPLDPKMREYRKFFAGRLAGVDGEAARRQPVQEILGDGAEVARALEYQKFIPDFVRVDAAANPETRQRQRYLAQLGRPGPGHLEHRRRGHHILGHAVLDGGDGDRLQIGRRPQQLEPKRQILRAPDAGIGVEMNAAVLLRAQFVQRGGQAVALRRIGGRGPALGILQQGIEGERIGGRGLRRRRGGPWLRGRRGLAA